MNENVLGFIKWGAGIVMTLAIISVVMLTFSEATNMSEEAIDGISELNTNYSESDLTVYDDNIVDGSVVVNALKKYHEDYMAIRVNTGLNPSGTWYIHSATISTSGIATMGAVSSSSMSDAQDETNADYINPNGKFKGKIHRDGNGTIVCIIFEQQ